MNSMLYTATKAIRAGGIFLSKHYDNISITLKNKDFLINNIHKTVEKIIYSIIQKSYPTHDICNIDNFIINNKKNKFQWIINPLDNKINFLKKIPHFSLSIVLLINNYTEIATIYNPILNELFTATRGYGAKLNNYRLRIKNNTKLNALVFNIAINIDNFKLINNFFFEKIKFLTNKYIDIRSTGSNSLDLIYVAAGRGDIFLGVNLQTKNFYAEKLLIKEAGGIADEFHIESNSININFYLAGDYILVNNFYKYINNFYQK